MPNTNTNSVQLTPYEEYIEGCRRLYADRLEGNLTRNEYAIAREAVLLAAIEVMDGDLEQMRRISSNIYSSREAGLLEDAMNAAAEAQGVRLCECCRSVVDPDDPYSVEHEGRLFCSTTCANDAGVHTCPQCGERFDSHSHDDDSVLTVGGQLFCSAECAHEAGYECCEWCGDWVSTGSYYSIELDGHFFCGDSCASHDFTRCAHCDEWVPNNRTYVVRTEEGNLLWCESCWEDETRECEGCGTCWDESVMEYDDEDDSYFCPSCIRRRNANGELHDYGWTPLIKFFGDYAKSPLLGVELETDGGYDREAYVVQLADIKGFKEHFWMTRDSSLENGVEITSMPCTLAYHANELADVYTKIRGAALANSFRSHDGGRCGLHVHVNRLFFGKSVDLQDVGGYKLMRLLQRFENELTKFSRRRSNRWCEYTTSGVYGPDEQGEPDSPSRTLDKARDMKYERRHEQALNFQHQNTFEFRIFRGTLNMSTYFACLALVNGMCHVAKMHSAHYVETVEWYQLMKDVMSACDEPKSREYLRDYLENKELL